MAQHKASVAYTPRADATAEAEVDALAAVYRFVLDCRAKKNPAADPSERGEDGTKPNSHDSHDVLPMLRDLYSKYPEARYLEPYELQSLLWSLRHTDKLLEEAEIAAAIEIIRTDLDPDEGAA